MFFQEIDDFKVSIIANLEIRFFKNAYFFEGNYTVFGHLQSVNTY